MLDEPERIRAFFWMTGAGVAALIAGALAMPLVVPVLRAAGLAPGLAPTEGLGVGQILLWLLHVKGWIADTKAWFSYLASLENPLAIALATAVPMAAAAAAFTIGLVTNPFEFHHKGLGDARYATDIDLARNELLGSTGLILGATKGGPFGMGSRYIRLPETLSALLICPPGAGKTAGIVIPNLLADWAQTKPVMGSETLGHLLGGTEQMKRPSFIVNDPKGELYQTTAGHLSARGYHVIRLAWGADFANRWNPISFDSLPGGRRVGALRHELLEELASCFAQPIDMFTRMMHEVRETSEWWRPLFRDPGALLEGSSISQARDKIEELVPIAIELFRLQAARQQYVERMTSVLIATPKGNSNDHFILKGREALSTFTLFIIYRCERDGREPSYGALLDALSSETDTDYSGQNAETDDATGSLMKDWLLEARASGYPSLIVDGLVALSTLAIRERSGVISTVHNGLGLFKNALTRQRTNASDFRLDDIRFGDAPIVVFLVVQLEDMLTLGRMSGMFVEATATRCISQEQSEIKARGRPILFLLDEFWTLPPGMASLMQIPALGRGQQVMMLLVGQSINQIAIQLERDAVDVLVGATSAKIIMSQNDDATAERFSKMVGNRTVLTRQVSSQGGLDVRAPAFSWNTSRSAQGVPLVTPQRLMSLDKRQGEQVVLVQGMTNRPILSTTPYFFKRGRAWSLLDRAGRPHTAPGLEELQTSVRQARAEHAAQEEGGARAVELQTDKEIENVEAEDLNEREVAA